MKVLVDAVSCPVVKEVEYVCKKHEVEAILVCDTSHILTSDYSKVIIGDCGRDSADMVLLNRCEKGDVVVTGDYGLASLVLTKGGVCIKQSGMLYTEKNIDTLIMQRYISKKARLMGKRVKGPNKRKKEDSLIFLKAFENLILERLKDR